MSLERLLKNNRLSRQASTPHEIAGLFESASHFAKNAGIANLESTVRFTLLYSAAIDLAMVLLRAGGFRTRGWGHHETAIDAVAYILGNEGKELSKYLQTCREKRNRISYSEWIDVPSTEVDELSKEVDRFRVLVGSWLVKTHPTVRPG